MNLSHEGEVLALLERIGAGERTLDTTTTDGRTRADAIAWALGLTEEHTLAALTSLAFHHRIGEGPPGYFYAFDGSCAPLVLAACTCDHELDEHVRRSGECTIVGCDCLFFSEQETTAAGRAQ